MVDRVYREDLPRLRRILRDLRSEFVRLETRTDWVGLRIDPLLRNLESLEGVLRAREFSKEFARLRRGVPMFHADLVYFRDNVKALREVLAAESGASR